MGAYCQIHNFRVVYDKMTSVSLGPFRDFYYFNLRPFNKTKIDTLRYSSLIYYVLIRFVVCPNGYNTTDAGRTCTDFDECVAQPCKSKNQNCTNIPGSYVCTNCITGYIDIGNNGTCFCK